MQENTIDFTLAMTGKANLKQIIASFENGLYKYDHALSEWYKIFEYPAKILYSFDLLIENGIDELIIAFEIVDGLYCYNFEKEKFTRLVSANTNQIISGDFTGDGKKELVCSFEGHGMYIIKPFNIKGGHCSRNWITDSRGWQIYRIGWFSPDEGHYISAGNIDSGHADELYLCIMQKPINTLIRIVYLNYFLMHHSEG